MWWLRLLVPFAGLLLSHFPVIVPTTNASAEGGDLLWQDQLHRGIDFGTAVAAHGKRVFAAGFSQNDLTPHTNFVRAYDARTGRLHWEHQSAKLDNSNDVQLAVARHRVFVSLGGATIRAHDVDTGAVLWEVDARGFVGGITAEQGLVVVAAGAFIQAFNASNGTLRWEDEPGQFVRFGVVSIGGRHVFGAGIITRPDGTGSAFLRAYNRWTGALDWEELLDNAADIRALTVHAGLVFVAGQNNVAAGRGAFVRAYTVRKGVLIWEDESTQDDGTPVSGSFGALAADGRLLVVAGGLIPGGVLIQANDIYTGELLWRAQPGKIGDFGALAVAGQRVYAAGTVEGATERNSDWLVQAYDLRTGTLRWEDQFDNAGSFDIARGEDVERGRLFVVGDVQTPSNFSDFLIRAYDAE